MQQLLNWTRRLVYPAAIVLLFWAAFQVIARPYISDRNGKILAIYDGDSTVQICSKEMTPDKENQSEEALAGFCRALLQHGSQEVDLLNIHEYENNPSDSKTTKIYQQLASHIAHGPVLGVISFLTSPDSPPVIRFCRTMQIPLLLALAANDDLLAPVEDTSGIVFRMMPRNGVQAADLATWLGKQDADPSLRVAVFHESNAFGEFLQRELERLLRPRIRQKKVTLYNFEVNEQMEFASLMPQLWCGKLDVIVYLGFVSRAKDLLNKLTWYRADRDQVTCPSTDPSRSFRRIKVILSSGAYAEELNDRDKYPFPFKVFAMLPTPPAAQQNAKLTTPGTSQDDDETGASEYGYDSYALLQSLAAHKFKIPSQPIDSSKTGHDYGFSENGELRPAEKNRYQVYSLGRTP